MDYVRKFLHVEGVLGQGAFGQVLATSPLQNQTLSPPPQQQPQRQPPIALTNGHHNYILPQQQQVPTNSSVSASSSIEISPLRTDLAVQQEKQAPIHTEEQMAICLTGTTTTVATPPKTPSTTASSVQSENRAFSQTSSLSLSSQSLVKSSNGSPDSSKRQQVHGKQMFALKCIHSILKPQRLASELRFLRDLGGQCNVVRVHAAHFYRGSLYIVMDSVIHDRFVDIVGQLDQNEIMEYMKNLLIALEHVHAHSIMHRDIKPANFLYNRKNKKFLLVDFGLAQSIRPRSCLFGNRSATNSSTNGELPTTPTSTIYGKQISMMKSSKTPNSSSHGRIISGPLFPENDAHRNKIHRNAGGNGAPDHQHKILHHLSKASALPTAQPSRNIIDRSPVRHYITNYKTTKTNGSPQTPHGSIKRQIHVLNSNDLKSDFKKLRLDSDVTREPVKLTVGAYESPVTNNDSSGRRNLDEHKFSTPTIPSRRTTGPKCSCRLRNMKCDICLSRPYPIAPRSGTPGFKAPEILLRYPGQTTAIDIWSAGVIFACLLSGHSPFFRDVDDTLALVDLVCIFGSKVSSGAKSLGIKMNVIEREPMNLMEICRKLRSNSKDKRQCDLPDTAFDLLSHMLEPDPHKRITASQALRHPWFASQSKPAESQQS